MASITVRNLDESVKKRLRKQAAENGRSLEAEVRDILNKNAEQPAMSPLKTGLDLFRGIREAVEKYGGVELEPFPEQVLAEQPAKIRRKPRK
jgi:plasmid stability protein